MTATLGVEDLARLEAMGRLEAWGAYRDEGVLGAGGMGEVHRVFDATLGRTVALKVARGDLAADRLARFVQEAKITAQLQHPGVVAVHELGTLPDGRVYFTMKEIRGRELGTVIREVHKGGGEAGGWTLRRLVAAFKDAADAVAYAHSRGVVHRDLKPANIMVGDYGEVVVVDWGLARLLTASLPASELAVPSPLTSPPTAPTVPGTAPTIEMVGVPAAVGEGGSALQTRAGQVQGTPAYMPPEQALGRVADVAEPADVYALGGVLFAILTGRAPFVADNAEDVLRRVVRGQREALSGRLPIPPELAAIVDRAMAYDPLDRFPDAGALANAVSDWLDGVRRHEDALAAVDAADALLPELASARSRAASLRAAAAELLDGVPPHAPEADKIPAWRKQDEAEEIERLALLDAERRIQLLHTALRLEPGLSVATRRLAEHYRAEHEAAEQAGDTARAVRAAVHLREYDDGSHAAYLRGEGAVTLVTTPPGATVVARPYVRRDRRLTLGDPVALGVSPLTRAALPAGSWRLEASAPGYATMVYPVVVPRAGEWRGVPPGALSPEPVPLLHPGELGPEDDYVPAGWAWVGGDADATDSLPLSRVWVPGFVIRRHPVTVAEYRTFLDALVAAGREDEALARRPRVLADDRGDNSPFRLGEDGAFHVVADDAGVIWEDGWPVGLVSAEDADAYAAWEADRTGLAWRLPHDLEWEKAARGVDRRPFPWGDHFEPTWARTVNSTPGTPQLTPVGAWPIDAGPYGTRDLAGQVRDWCRNHYVRPEAFGGDGKRVAVTEPGRHPFRVARGGVYTGGPTSSRGATRLAGPPTGRWQGTGFRLARGL